jgi:hypothetical protein
VAADVLGQFLDRSVAPFRLPAQRLEDDFVEVPLQFAPGFNAAGGRGRIADGGARPADASLDDGTQHLFRRAAAEAVRVAARQKYVEQHAEGVDVVRLRRRQPAQLLRARVLGRHHAVGRGRRVARPPRGVQVEEFGDAEV